MRVWQLRKFLCRTEVAHTSSSIFCVVCTFSRTGLLNTTRLGRLSVSKGGAQLYVSPSAGFVEDAIVAFPLSLFFQMAVHGRKYSTLSLQSTPRCMLPKNRCVHHSVLLPPSHERRIIPFILFVILDMRLLFGALSLSANTSS